MCLKLKIIKISLFDDTNPSAFLLEIMKNNLIDQFKIEKFCGFDRLKPLYVSLKLASAFCMQIFYLDFMTKFKEVLTVKKRMLTSP